MTSSRLAWGALALPPVPICAGLALFAYNQAAHPLPWVNHDVAFHAYLGFYQRLDGSL